MTVGPDVARKLHDEKVKPGLLKLEHAIDKKLLQTVASEFTLIIPASPDYNDLMPHNLSELSMKYQRVGWPSFRITQTVHGIEIDANKSTDQRDYMRSYQEDR